MNKDLNFNLKAINLPALFDKVFKKYGRHAVFAAVILVLLSYMLVVFRISSLAKAEPSADQATSQPIVIPKVDQEAIDHIQSLEANNTQLHGLFDQARNNPFQE
jgi:hypothetical protein